MKEGKPPGLEVKNYRRGIAEETVGRIGALPTNIILATPEAILGKVSKDTGKLVKEKYKDIKWQGNVEVHLNRSPLFRQVKRLFEKERRANLFARSTLGLVTTVSSWLTGKYLRSNLYNPFTETVQVYHKNPAVAMHEVGHAVDYDKRKRPTVYALSRLIPGSANLQEWRASHNAMRHLDKSERNEAKKVLEPAFGSYTGAPLLPFKNLARWVRPATYAGILGGHIHARADRRNIFYNGKEGIRQAKEKKSVPKVEKIVPIPIHKPPIHRELEKPSAKILTNVLREESAA